MRVLIRWWWLNGGSARRRRQRSREEGERKRRREEEKKREAKRRKKIKKQKGKRQWNTLTSSWAHENGTKSLGNACILFKVTEAIYNGSISINTSTSSVLNPSNKWQVIIGKAFKKKFLAFRVYVRHHRWHAVKPLWLYACQLDAPRIFGRKERRRKNWKFKRWRSIYIFIINDVTTHTWDDHVHAVHGLAWHHDIAVGHKQKGRGAQYHNPTWSLSIQWNDDEVVRGVVSVSFKKSTWTSQETSQPAKHTWHA